jgi:glycosyltransferase involved in cell wall biosynthesis
VDNAVRFSIVIPTHNRLGLLRDAVGSVLRQEFTDFELIVFDNASTDDLKQFVESLHDPRVRYHRSERFLPVTDSWNSALDLATGKYVVLLGDDDGLAPGYFNKMWEIISRFGNPDLLYTDIYQFWHPGVYPPESDGHVDRPRNAFFFEERNEPFVLPAKESRRAVVGSLTLRRNFTFNMQAFCFSAEFLNRLRLDGPVFRSPAPDYYLANVALALSRKTVVVPAPMAVAGVSRKSYGFTLFNGLEEKGAELLNTDLLADQWFTEVEPFLLPGPRYDTNYILTMVHVTKYLGKASPARVNYERYRRLQIYRVLEERRGPIDRSRPDDARLLSRLTTGERFWANLLGVVIKSARDSGAFEKKLQKLLWQMISPYDYSPSSNRLFTGQHRTLPELLDTLENKSPAHGAGLLEGKTLT